MQNSKIKTIEYYLPENIIDNSRLEEEFPEWSINKIEGKTGVRKRHIVDEKETALDLAYKASLKVLENYDRNKIDFLILCTQSPDYFLPSSSCILQDKLRLKKETGAFDFNLGCSGYIYGLALAKSLIASNIANNILLVVAETYSKYLNQKDRSNRTIFGDGAAATIVEKTEDERIFDFILGTDGSGYKNLIVLNGCARNKFDKHANEIADGNGNIRTNNNLYMNGPEIFNFAIKEVPKLVFKVLEKNNMCMEDIDYIIFHQANKFMLEHLRNKIVIPKGKFYNNIMNTGNTVSPTIPIALKDCIEQKIVKKGNKILLIGFGVGYSFGGTIIKI